MKKMLVLSALALAGCAAAPDQSSTSPEALSECLQPNRRVVVEVVGLMPPKPKPAAKKPEAAPEAKPKKPRMQPVQDTRYIQGNTAFDVGGATLKEGGMKDINSLLASLNKRNVTVNAVVLSGHTDKLEEQRGNKALGEQRAKAVRDYLVSQGVSEKIIFWEGKGASQPVPVTKFCS